MILIARHAQSAANAGGSTSIAAAIPITEIGSRQASCLASHVTQEPGLIVVSPFLRAKETAGPLRWKFPATMTQEWPAQEFTYLDAAACAGTTYRERAHLRAAFWKRSDPNYSDGPACESFFAFSSRILNLHRRLALLDQASLTVLVTHGLVMRMLLWLRQCRRLPETGAAMAAFNESRRSSSIPNCAILYAKPGEDGWLDFPRAASVAHLPNDLVTE